MLNIAFLSNGLFPYVVGGMQKHSVNLVRHLPENDIAVDLYYINTDAYPDKSEIQKELFKKTNSVRLHPVQCPGTSYYPGHYFRDCYRRSREFAKSMLDSGRRYDFIYAQGYMGWVACKIRKRNPNLLPPIGINFHGLEALQLHTGVKGLFASRFAPIWQRKNIKLCDCILSLGGRLDQIASHERFDRDSVPIVPSANGIAEHWFDGQLDNSKQPGSRRFLFVGRYEIRKGIKTLYEAIGHLPENIDCRFDFVGPIPDNKKLSDSRVVYHGAIRDEQKLKQIYQECDVLVCPSYAEGMPTVILEAMACGKPVIGTDVGAVRLLVSDENGWLIAPHRVDQLTHAIIEACDSDLSEKGRTSVNVAKNFLWKNVAEQTALGIREFLGEQ